MPTLSIPNNKKSKKGMKNPLKVIKYQISKLLKSRKKCGTNPCLKVNRNKQSLNLFVQIPSISLQNKSNTPIIECCQEPMALCNQLSVSQSEDHGYGTPPSDLECSTYSDGSDHEFGESRLDSLQSPSPPLHSRSYKLLSTQAMSSKQFPKSFGFTDNEYSILNKGWNILTQTDINILSSEFREMLYSMDNGIYKDLFLNSEIDININESIFDLFFGILNKMIIDNEYRGNDNDNDMLSATSIVLRMIGIRYVIKYKIIPNDYQIFKQCFDTLFIKYLSKSDSKCNHQQFMSLLNKCWDHIIASITIAFDFKE